MQTTSDDRLFMQPQGVKQSIGLSLIHLSSFSHFPVDSFRPHSGSLHKSAINTTSNRVLVSLRGPWVTFRWLPEEHSCSWAGRESFLVPPSDSWPWNKSTFCIGSEIPHKPKQAQSNCRESYFVNTQTLLHQGTSKSVCVPRVLRVYVQGLRCIYHSVRTELNWCKPVKYDLSIVPRAIGGKEDSGTFVFRNSRSDDHFPSHRQMLNGEQSHLYWTKNALLNSYWSTPWENHSEGKNCTKEIPDFPPWY